MRCIDPQSIAAATPYPELIDALEQAFRRPATGPLRSHHELRNGDGSTTTLLVMPCSHPGGRLGLKLVTVNPGNAARGLPTVQAAYMLGFTDTGGFDAVLDGTALTLRRTAATSALASRFLSRQDAKHLLLVGAGSLAGPLARAHLVVRPIREIRIWNRSFEKAERLAEALALETGVTASATNYLAESTAWADIITCATTSTEPLVLGRHLRAGQHLDLVGAYTPAMRETDDDAIVGARVFVDERQAALAEAGDLIQPLRAGRITPAHIVGDLSQLVRGEVQGRTSPLDITLFKSVGLALEDLAAAELVVSSGQDGHGYSGTGA